MTSPLGVDPPTGPSASSRGVEPDPAGPLRVLIAEDDDTLSFLARRFTEKLGHTVRTVGNGADAVAAALTDGFDVVLMDVHMPQMGGMEAARRIRAAGDGIGQPWIIALTAAAAPAVQDQCRAAGMDAFLTKPLRSVDLRMALRDVPVSAAAPTAGPSTPAEPFAPAADGPPHPTAEPFVPAVDGPPHPTAEPFAPLRGFPPDIRAQVLRTFLEHSADDVEQLGRALDGGDDERARFLAHRLRGASAAIGATALAARCRDIEEAATRDPAPVAPAQLRTEFATVQARIEAIERAAPPA